jgi:DNA-binding PadR family transcriptional regulator
MAPSSRALTALGRFEHIVLLATLHVGADAYAVSIREEIQRRTRATPARGALYTTLARLEAKGLLASSVGEPTAVRGGKAKRYYRLTAAGETALRNSRMELVSAWTRAARLLAISR